MHHQHATPGAGQQQFERSASGMGAHQGQSGGQMHGGATLDEALSPSMHAALDDAIEAIGVCEWCADQCIDEGPGMARCIRLCRDVADLARLHVTFLTRGSTFGPDVARAFATAAEECAVECQQHPHAHCQECAEVLNRAARSARNLLASAGNQSAVQGQAGMAPVGPQ